MIILLPAPTIATIDENYNLTANWQPFTVNGSYTAYEGWTITLQTPPNTGIPITTTVANNNSTFSFAEQLSAGDYAMNMMAVSSDITQYTNSSAWDSSHTFPSALLAADVSIDNTNLLLGQTFTITLGSTYAANVPGVPCSWQILFPDNTSTGWLPLSTRSVAKSLNTAGAQNIIIQTQNDYGTNAPPVKLRRQLTQQIFVVDQQYSPTNTTQGVLTGTLGIGGNIEFEITNASTGIAVPQPYEVVVRSVARDTVTNELKLMVATSRFSNASSLLSTMAIDVFPMVGRPHAKELIEPSYILEVNPATSSIPVGIATTTLPSNVYVGKPMTEFPMVAAPLTTPGGTPVYSWYATGLPPGLKMNISGTISGTPTQLGVYEVTFAVMDSSSPAFIAEVTLPFTIPTDLNIITSSPLPKATVGAAYNGVQILNSGGLAPFTWAVVSGQLPVGMTIDPASGDVQGTPCTYTSIFPNSDYTETYSFVVQVTDAINSKASLNFSLKLAPAPLTLGNIDQYLITASEQYKLAVPVFGGHLPYVVANTGVNYVDGQIEFLVAPPVQAEGLISSFSVVVTDSGTPPQTVSQLINYKAKQPISSVYDAEAFFDNYWGANDSTAITHAIVGNLAGFSIQSSTTVLSNGLTLDINGPAKTIVVTGPPTSYLNTQVPVQLPILQGSNQVATITREYTLLTHNGTGLLGSPPTENIGTAQCITRPYLVGDMVGLNPLKPWLNSPTVNTTGLTGRVQTGSVLPPGLSFDANTLLIYGTLSGTTLAQSIIEYVDVNAVVQGTITISWDTTKNAFSPTDNLIDMGVQTSVVAGASTIAAAGITSCSVYRGRLPLQANGQPLSLQIDPSGAFVSVVGTPTEAGYFDVWFRLTNANGQAAVLYHRLFVDYVNPLVILTASLPSGVVGQAYTFQLQAFGGVPFSPPAQPYTWSLASTPSGMSFNVNTGVLSGTPTGVTTNLNFTVTDSRGVIASTTLTFTVIGAVVIETAVLPTIQVDEPYSFAMVAVGGVTPYNWVCSPVPTGGILFSAGGVFSGETAAVYNPQSVAITVTDFTGGHFTKNFTLQSGAPGGLSIDASAVGPIDRGAPYQGTMRAIGIAPVPYLPVSWTVSVGSPNPLPTGLILQANGADQGTTAIISGSVTAVLVGYSVIISATDAVGDNATITLSLNTDSSLAITTASLPQGTVGVSYNGGSSLQLTASGYNTPYTWSVVSSEPSAFPYTLSSSGVITGTSASAFNGSVTFQVSDSLSPSDTAQATLGLVVSASTLQITTASPLPQGTAGISYTAPLVATGGVAPYTWSLSPASANPLPPGLNLGAGVISGTTTFVGTTTFTIRVTDNISSYNEKTFSVTFNSGLTLKTGIDYTDSVSTSYLGYVDAGNTGSINPRTNRSFYVVATGVITANPAVLTAGITLSNNSFSASVTSLVGGVAYILITGPFATAGSLGDNTLGITVVDSGVTATGTFKWKIFSDGTLRAIATNAFPTQLVTA